MGKKNLVVLFYFYCFLGYSQQKIYFDEEWLPTTKEKMVFYREISKEKNLFHIKDFFKSGKLQMEGYSTNDETNNEAFEGKVVWYFENGKTSKISEFKKGLPVGKEIECDEQGRVIADLIFSEIGFSGKKFEYKDSEESYGLYNSIWEYEDSQVIKYIRYDNDIDGIREESYMPPNSERYEKFYDKEGHLIGTKYDNRNEKFSNTEVDFYYNPMKIYRIIKKDKKGYEREIKTFYPSGALKQEESIVEKGYKKTYDENGNTIGVLSYADYGYGVSWNGEDVIFDDETFELKTKNYYKDGVQIKSEAFFPNGDKKIIFYNPRKKITKTEYFDSNGSSKGIMEYNEQEQPVSGTRFNYYDGRETKYENGKMVYDKIMNEGGHVAYEKTLNISQNKFYVKVFNGDGSLHFSYELPDNAKDDKFTSEVAEYKNNKPVNKIKFINGIIQNGKLTLHYDSYTKTYERKADWIFASTYNENNTLTDTIKGKADEIDGGSQLTVRESDFLNNGDRQTREVVDFVPQAIELSSKNRNQ